jgi:hypothetical protein
MNAVIREATLEYLAGDSLPGYPMSEAEQPMSWPIVEAALGIARKFASRPGAVGADGLVLAEAIDGWDNFRGYRALRRECNEHPERLGLRESIPSSAFGQLLRAGVQLQANSWYRRTKTTWQGVATESTSDKAQEFHAPLFGMGFPRKQMPGTPFKEIGIKGQDRMLVNAVYGAIVAFDRELFDDDQTGQIAERPRHMGESAALWEDVYFATRFIGAASNAYPEPIDASTWTGVNADAAAINTPWNAAMYSTAIGGNIPAAGYAQFSYERVLEAYQQLRLARDPLNVPMVVVPNTILNSAFDEMTISKFIKSGTAPYVAPLGFGANVGLMKGAFSENEFQGMFKQVSNVFLPLGAWALGEAQKGFMFQRRDPMEIVQEVPNSGQSFESGAFRYRVRTRWEQDWIDPRFWFLGNDGSANLTR